MGLKFEVDTLEGVEEAMHGLYAKGEDGKFRLSVEGLPEPEDNSGLKSALEAERKKAKSASRWDKLGKTPEEIQEILDREAQAAEEKQKKAGEFDQIRQQDREKFATELAAKDKALAAMEASERGAIIENHLLSALVKAGATETGVALLPDQLAGRIKIESEDGKRVIKIMQVDGETLMAGSEKNGMASFEDLAKEAMTKFPDLFKSSRPGGGGTPPGGGAGGGSGTKMLRKEFDAMSPHAKMEAMRKGVELID